MKDNLLWYWDEFLLFTAAKLVPRRLAYWCYIVVVCDYYRANPTEPCGSSLVNAIQRNWLGGKS
jgi:hypothetical protein